MSETFSKLVTSTYIADTHIKKNYIQSLFSNLNHALSYIYVNC